MQYYMVVLVRQFLITPPFTVVYHPLDRPSIGNLEFWSAYSFNPNEWASPKYKRWSRDPGNSSFFEKYSPWSTSIPNLKCLASPVLEFVGSEGKTYVRSYLSPNLKKNVFFFKFSCYSRYFYKVDDRSEMSACIVSVSDPVSRLLRPSGA